MSSSNGEPWVPEEESWPSSPLAGEDDVVIRCRTLASQEALHGAAYEAGTASSHAESVKLRHASVRAVRGVEAVQPEPAAARPWHARAHLADLRLLQGVLIICLALLLLELCPGWFLRSGWWDLRS